MNPHTKHKASAIVGLLAALVYLVVPTDVVPDVIPVAGWLDDTAAILLAVANAVRMVRKMKQ